MSEHKSWATPAPAGLIALAVACGVFYAYLSGTVGWEAYPLMAIWLFGGFVVQIVVATIELKEGHVTGGNVFLFFSSFFMLVGSLGFMFKYFAKINAWPLQLTIDGWGWLPLLIALLFITFAYLKESSAIMAVVVLSLDIAVFFVTFMNMGVMSPTWAPIAAYFVLLAGAGAIWLACAVILNTAFGKTILPVPGPILKAKEQAITASISKASEQ